MGTQTHILSPTNYIYIIQKFGRGMWRSKDGRRRDIVYYKNDRRVGSINEMGKGVRLRIRRKGLWRDGSICDVDRKYQHLILFDFEDRSYWMDLAFENFVLLKGSEKTKTIPLLAFLEPNDPPNLPSRLP